MVSKSKSLLKGCLGLNIMKPGLLEGQLGAAGQPGEDVVVRVGVRPRGTRMKAWTDWTADSGVKKTLLSEDDWDYVKKYNPARNQFLAWITQFLEDTQGIDNNVLNSFKLTIPQ